MLRNRLLRRVGGAISNAPVVSRLLDLLTVNERLLAAEVVAEHREQAVAARTREADSAQGRALHRAFDDAKYVLDARASLRLLFVGKLLERFKWGDFSDLFRRCTGSSRSCAPVRCGLRRCTPNRRTVPVLRLPLSGTSGREPENHAPWTS